MSMTAPGWFSMESAARTRDLWAWPTGPTAPQYGRWITPSGKDVERTLASEGPPGVDVEWWFGQPSEHRGTRDVDMVWQSGIGLKLLSQRLVELLQDHDARLQTFPADVRLRNGTPVPGYVAVLESIHEALPAHSWMRGRRVDCLVVSSTIHTEIQQGDFTGITFTPVASEFPGQHSG